MIQLEHFPIWRRPPIPAAEPPESAKIVILQILGPRGKTNEAIVGIKVAYDLWEQSALIFRLLGSKMEKVIAF